MRKWWGLVGVVLVAACGEDKSAELTARFQTTTVAAAAVAPTTTVAVTTITTTTSTTTVPVEQPVIVEGQGQLQSAPFRLIGGRYKSTWETFNDCYYAARLGPEFNTIINAQGATSGETFVNNVKAGEYYVDMITGPVPRCRWKVTLQKA